MRSLASAVPYKLPVSTKGYVEPLPSLPDGLQSKRGECEATTRQFDKKSANVEELELKVV